MSGGSTTKLTRCSSAGELAYAMVDEPNKGEQLGRIGTCVDNRTFERVSCTAAASVRKRIGCLWQKRCGGSRTHHRGCLTEEVQRPTDRDIASPVAGYRIYEMEEHPQRGKLLAADRRRHLSHPLQHGNSHIHACGGQGWRASCGCGVRPGRVAGGIPYRHVITAQA